MLAAIAGEPAMAPEPATMPEPPAPPSPPPSASSPMTLIQANLLVAMLGGFWARKADGHPGPDLMGRGLLILNALVEWERLRKVNARHNPSPKADRFKPG